MTDPLSAIILAGFAGGAAGKVAENAVDAARDWIGTHIGNHGQRTQERAEANAAEFIVDVANRVRRIEEDLKKVESDDRISERLSDPDFAASLQDALIASARTESREKHELLAEAVATRLSSEPESITALACSSAISAIPKLNDTHLRLLGMLWALYWVRPGVVEGTSAVSLDQYPSAWNVIFGKLQVGFRFSGADLEYLAGVGCVSISVGSRQLAAVMGLDVNNELQKNTFEKILRTDAGSLVTEQWEKGSLKHLTILPVGSMIGESVFRQRVLGLNAPAIEKRETNLPGSSLETVWG